jgi:hypothetical protein
MFGPTTSTGDCHAAPDATLSPLIVIWVSLGTVAVTLTRSVKTLTRAPYWATLASKLGVSTPGVIVNDNRRATHTPVQVAASLALASLALASTHIGPLHASLTRASSTHAAPTHASLAASPHEAPMQASALPSKIGTIGDAGPESPPHATHTNKQTNQAARARENIQFNTF